MKELKCPHCKNTFPSSEVVLKDIDVFPKGLVKFLSCNGAVSRGSPFAGEKMFACPECCYVDPEGFGITEFEPKINTAHKKVEFGKTIYVIGDKEYKTSTGAVRNLVKSGMSWIDAERYIESLPNENLKMEKPVLSGSNYSYWAFNKRSYKINGAFFNTRALAFYFLKELGISFGEATAYLDSLDGNDRVASGITTKDNDSPDDIESMWNGVKVYHTLGIAS